MATKINPDTVAKDAADATDGDTSAQTDNSSAVVATVETTDTTPENPESLTDPGPKDVDTEPVIGSRTDTVSTEPMDDAARPGQPIAATAVGEPQDTGNGVPAKRIAPLTDQELFDELDGEDPSLGDFIKKHYDAQDANIQQLARVLRLEVTEVFDILKELGYVFPQGV